VIGGGRGVRTTAPLRLSKKNFLQLTGFGDTSARNEHASCAEQIALHADCSGHVLQLCAREPRAAVVC
jgi:hypothetical protein